MGHLSCFLSRLAGLSVAFFALSAQTLAQSTIPAAAEDSSPAAILENIQRQAGEIAQLRSALDNPEQSARIAAFNAMVNSGNSALEELAIATAFASADEATKALAIRAAFKSVQVLEVELSGPQDPSDDTTKALEYIRRHSGATIKNIEYDPQTGKFAGKDRNDQGQVSGRNIAFSTSRCGGSLNNKEGTWEFLGKVRCGNSVFDGKFTLR